MRIILLSMALYIGLVSWLIWDGYRIEATVYEAQQTVGFDHYLVWTCRHDRTPKEAIRKAEAWALATEPEEIDAVNVRAWVVMMKGGKKK